MRRRRICMTVIGGLALLLAGCSMTPTKRNLRLGPSYTNTMTTVERVGVWVDVPVIYTMFTRDYVDLEYSSQVISNVVRETVADLKAKGYEVAFVVTPFIGGGLATNVAWSVVSTHKAEPEVLSPPFYTETETNRASMGAWVNAARSVGEAMTKRKLLCSLPHARESLAAIAAEKNVRFVLLVQGYGEIPSLGNSMGRGVLMGVGFGAAAAVLSAPALLESRAGLVDLEQAEILWKNEFRFDQTNPLSEDSYKLRDWSGQLLYWLPVRGKWEYLPDSHYHYIFPAQAKQMNAAKYR